MTRRAVLGAATIVGLTGGAAEAMHPKNDFNPFIKRRPHHHHRRGGAPSTPNPSQSPDPTPTQDPTQTPSPNPTGNTGGPFIGMGANDWATRLSDVGAGLTARRIYADLSQGGNSQISLVAAAHDAGMLPVISYKVGGDVKGAIAGDFNSAAQQAAAQLDSFGLPVAVTVWHEPYTDISPADYIAMSRKLLPVFKRGKVQVGPILNGWLLSRNQDTFASFCSDDLFQLWDWVGMDTYPNGTAANPGDAAPAPRIPQLSQFVASRGYPDMPLGVGEFNGWTAGQIADVGTALLTTPNVWFGCVWNNNGALAEVLTGDRLKAFQKTVADPRSADPIS